MVETLEANDSTEELNNLTGQLQAEEESYSELCGEKEELEEEIEILKLKFNEIREIIGK